MKETAQDLLKLLTFLAFCLLLWLAFIVPVWAVIWLLSIAYGKV